MILCKNCILPETFPGIHFNDEGVCNFCLTEPEEFERDKITNQLQIDMECLFDEIKLNNKNEYDVVVAFSGGKDSTYTLMKLTREYGLRCLAVTINNGFIPQQTLNNCHKVTEVLKTDFIWFTPSFDFMRNMYKASVTGKPTSPSAIKRSSNICASCINLINNQMVKIALKSQVPVIAGGYIGGQVPKNAAIMNLSVTKHTASTNKALDKYVTMFGAEAKKYFGFDRGLLQDNDKDIYLINPMLIFEKSEKEIIDEIETLGWIQPKNTGLNSTNCMLNDVGVKAHYEKYGFHPYVGELADMVRKGLMGREEALIKVEKIPDLKSLKRQIDKLQLTEKDLF